MSLQAALNCWLTKIWQKSFPASWPLGGKILEYVLYFLSGLFIGIWCQVTTGRSSLLDDGFSTEFLPFLPIPISYLCLPSTCPEITCLKICFWGTSKALASTATHLIQTTINSSLNLKNDLHNFLLVFFLWHPNKIFSFQQLDCPFNLCHFDQNPHYTPSLIYIKGLERPYMTWL